MNITQLRYFVAIYEEKGITAAAKRCSISQPSISTALKQLEEELETTLFIRHKKGVETTEEAHHLYPLATRFINSLAELPEKFRQHKNDMPLALGIFPDLSPSNVEKTLRTINESVENLALNLVGPEEHSDARITIDVLKNEDEIFLPLWEEDYVLCMRKDHPFAKCREICSEKLHGYNFIECPPCEAHKQTIGLVACNGSGLNIVARASSKGQVKQLVRAGYGISFLPSGLLEEEKNLVTVPYSGPRMFRRIGLCYPANRTLCPPLVKIVRVFGNIPEKK